MAAAVLAEYQVAARQAYILGPKDFVGGVMLQHAVLMDSRLVGKRIFAHDRLVARDGHAGDAGDEARSRVEAGGVALGADPQKPLISLLFTSHFLRRATLA